MHGMASGIFGILDSFGGGQNFGPWSSRSKVQEQKTKRVFSILPAFVYTAMRRLVVDTCILNKQTATDKGSWFKRKASRKKGVTYLCHEPGPAR